MLNELTAEFKSAAVAGYAPAGAGALQIWGASLKEILERVLEKALELGIEYRDDIEQAAKRAVDSLIAMDLPGIPPTTEAWIDEAARAVAYRAIESMLDAILSPNIIG